MADAFTNRILGSLTTWTNWLSANGVVGCVGEFGWPGDNPAEYWPGDAALWDALGESYYDALQAAGMWSLQWGCSESFSGYELAPYTGVPLNTRRPQGIPLENHLSDENAGGWPSGWPAAPVLPTGLTVITSGSYSPTTSNREYRNMGTTAAPLDVKTSPTGASVSNVIFRNCVFDYLEVQPGANNFWFIDCTILMSPGANPPYTPLNVWNGSGGGNGTQRSNNIVFDGCTIKNAVRTTEDIHIEGMHVTVCRNLWIKNCTFVNNSLYNISLQCWGTYADLSVRYVLIEDNTFEPCHTGLSVDHDQHSVVCHDDGPSENNHGYTSDVVIRNNVVKTHDVSIEPGCRAQRSVAGNNRDQNGTLLPNIGTVPSASSVRRGVALTGLEFGDWLAGFSNTQPGSAGDGTGYVANSQASWNYLAGRGVTCARVGFRWERIQRTLGGALDGPYLALVQQQVARAKAAGVDVVLDCHNFGEYHLDTGPSVTVVRLGSAQLTQAHLVNLWQRLSAVFDTETGVVGYGIMNEPHDVVGGAAAWETISNAVCNAVRTLGDNKLLLVGGHNWSKVQGWASQHPDKWITASNVRYEAHHYWDTESSEQAGVPSGSQKEDSVYVQTYDEAVADSSTTVYVTDPRPSETMTTNPITVKGVASTTGSTTITVRVYNSNNVQVHGATTTRSGRTWAVTLSGFTFTTGSWRIQAQQDSTLSNNRLFPFLAPARKQIALPAGPSASWHGPGTNPSTGNPGGQTVIATGVNSPHRFAQAADFYDSVGINSHVIYGGPYDAPAGGMNTYLDRLQELGIRHVREGLWSPATSNVGYQWNQVAALGQKVRARNVATTDQTKKIQMLWGTPKEPASMPAGYQYTVTPTNGTFLRPLDGPGGNGYTTIGWYDVACLQGPNEPGYTWTPNWTDFRRIIRALKDAKNARTAVGAFTGTEWIDFTTGRTAGPGAGAPKVVCVGFAPASYTDPGDYSNGLDLDVGSPHIYWGGHEPNFTEFWDPGSGSWSNKACYNGALSATGRYSRTVPLVCTESGYITGLGDAGPGGGQRHCPPDVAGEYLIRTLLQNYMGGIKRTYIFSMTHSDSGGGNIQFGLCDNSWNRLACFYAVKNLMSLVGWEQGPDPNPFNVTMSGFTLGGNNVDSDGYQSPDRIDKLVLRRGQDEWLIILTRQRSIWNRGNQTYKTVADPKTVTLQLPAGNWVAGVAEPAKNVIDSPNDGLSYANSANGTAYAPLTVSGTDTVTLQLAGLTRVIRITRAAGDAPTGAIDVSGAKTSRRTLRNLPSGAIDVAGTRVESKRHSASRTGAVDVNGTLTAARTLSSSVTGTVRVTGAKTERATHRSVPAIGGLQVSGSRTEAYSKTYTDSRAGTVTLRGSIGESWKQVDTYHDVPAPGLADVNGTLTENYQVFNGEGTRTGTVTLRGSLGESWKQVDVYQDVPAPGLADVNGTLTRGVVKRDFPSGAISLDGNISETWATDHDTDVFGNLVLAGAPGEAFTSTRTRVGTVTLAGAVTEAWTSGFVDPSGQLTLGGTMSSTYFHNDVVTGNLANIGVLSDAIRVSYTFGAVGQIGGSLDEFWTRGRLPHGRIEAGHSTMVARD